MVGPARLVLRAGIAVTYSPQRPRRTQRLLEQDRRDQRLSTYVAVKGASFSSTSGGAAETKNGANQLSEFWRAHRHLF